MSELKRVKMVFNRLQAIALQLDQAQKLNWDAVLDSYEQILEGMDKFEQALQVAHIRDNGFDIFGEDIH